jgi:hypothetical protein
MNIRRTKTSKPHSCSGWTFIEVLVASGISILVFLAVTSFFVTTNRLMVMMGNYNGMDQMNRFALDTMNRDIRNAQALTSYSTNQLVFTNAVVSTSFTYTYSPSAGTLTRTWGGQSMTLLSNLSFLSFDIYQRNPSNNFLFYSANGTAANAKLVNMVWKSYKTVMGQRANTETMTTAEVVMRN